MKVKDPFQGATDFISSDLTRMVSDRPFFAREDAPPDEQAQLVQEIQVGIFDISNNEDRVRYQKILNICTNLGGTIITRQIKFDEEKKRFLVYVEWAMPFFTTPELAKENRDRWLEEERQMRGK